MKALDPPRSGLAHPENIRHVGPVLERERHMRPANLAWRDDDAAPIVLVSFSTMPEQGSAAKFQNAIDALAPLPVRGVVTTGDSLDPALLKPAANVAVFANADHDQFMRHGALVVTHGGHGTMMRALSYGLPLVVIPGLASDQPVNAASVQAWGAGRALAKDAGADDIRAAVREVLDAPSYRAAARRIAQEFAGVDGAIGAAEEIERLLTTSDARRGADRTLVPAAQ